MSKQDYMNIAVQEPPLDYSFRSIHVIQDLTSEEPRRGLRPLRHSKSGKSLTQSLWLNNNVLNDLKDFSHVVSQLLEHPEKLAWIDLSFNDLTSIDPVLTTFFNLSVLYLHGNSIQRLGEVNKLAVLPRLRSLTLHGNPIEEEKGYRAQVRDHVARHRAGLPATGGDIARAVPALLSTASAHSLAAEPPRLPVRIAD
uniref:Leucine-rich repeat-containing protein 51 n=2 Tax=Equus caballus TaxID=9796 RepID=A0A9L0ST64_HORSE